MASLNEIVDVSLCRASIERITPTLKEQASFIENTIRSQLEALRKNHYGTSQYITIIIPSNWNFTFEMCMCFLDFFEIRFGKGQIECRDIYNPSDWYKDPHQQLLFMSLYGIATPFDGFRFMIKV